MRLVPLLAVTAALGVAATCNPPKPPLAIQRPKVDSVLTAMPLDVELLLRATADLQTLVVTLDGVDITGELSLFVLPDGRYLAGVHDFWDPALLVAGEHALVASAVVGGSPAEQTRTFTLSGEPYADAVAALQLGAQGGFGDPAFALGAPRGQGLFQGSLDVLSLGLGGTIELEFVDNLVVDGPGADLAVFENAFLEISAAFTVDPPFAEPARVSVSQDGLVWLEFPCPLSLAEAPLFPGCAGVYPTLADVDDPTTPHAAVPTETPLVDLLGQDALALAADPPAGAGGDAFDLADVGLAWARYVRIEAATFVNGPAGPDNAGFDLDAVVAIHSEPAP